MIDRTHAAGIESMMAQIRQYQSQLKPPANPMAASAALANPAGVAQGGSPLGAVANLGTPGIRPAAETLATGIREAGAPLPKPSFADVVRRNITNVNEAQNTARELAGAYERGEEVPLTDVVIAMQKSSLAFEATLQVRNKVLKAYEDIMNMPV